jgi:hypothetical protein
MLRIADAPAPLDCYTAIQRYNLTQAAVAVLLVLDSLVGDLHSPAVWEGAA